MIRLVWLAVAVAAGTAALVWARSARYRARLAQRLDVASGDSDLKQLARAGLRRDVHTTVLYATVAVAGVVGALTASGTWVAVTLVAVGLPVGLTVAMAATMRANARLEMGRSQLERRAQQVLVQDQLAPRRWSQRLAPDDLAAVDGLEVGRAYQPGDGMLAGDFYDLVVVGPDRVAAVVGDVSGHGIEPAITAFQAKYLLRVFLRQFRDPAQAVEELNRQMASIGRPDEFVSLWVAVHDNGVGTLR
jgi:hypothetical protein